ncbi:MAG TPA: hypothetical protein V6D02_04375 [Candidatus Obscuribacterales bacterium]
MAAEIVTLLVALKEWQKAIAQLKHQGKSASEKHHTLEKARQQVLQQLQSEAIAKAIDELIAMAIAPDTPAAADVRATLSRDADSLLTVELRSVHPLTVSRKELEQVAATFLASPEVEQPIANSQELRAVFQKLSAAIPTAYREAIAVSRKQKKRRRRDLTIGTLQTVLGVGLIAGNTQIDAAFASSSYILGGNALIVAMQYLVGQLVEGDG